MKIQYDPKKAIPVDIKRFYLPLTISDECPKCGVTIENNCQIKCLSYPTLNVPLRETFRCEDCDEEWPGWIRLDLNVKAVVAPDDDADDANTAVSSSKESQDASSS